MAEDERAAHLRDVPFFSEALDRQQLSALAAKTRFSTFPAGATLMASGDFGVAMYASVTGKVQVRLVLEGVERDVAGLGPGDIVGEMSLMTGARRNATVTALSTVTALEITKVALEEVLWNAPQLDGRFGAVLASRQAELDRIASEAEHSADDIAGQIRSFFHTVFRS